MKYIVALISMIYSMNCFSQTINTDLFQTWYLYDISSSDTGQHNPVSAISPAISPNITFTENLDIYGDGSCNAFTGTFNSPFADVLQFDNFISTLMFCDSADQSSYEGAFFSLLYPGSGGQYFISGEGDNMSLVISTPIFADYTFRNSQLGAQTFDLKQTVIYPNPVTSNLFIDAQNNSIDKIEIFNSLGQLVKSMNTDSDVINVSIFTAGVYSIKIYSDGKSVCKKIIKK